MINQKGIIRIISLIIVLSFFIKVNAQPNYKYLNPCQVSEAKDSAFCGTLLVFENRKTKQGKKISLNIIVIPASDKLGVQSPIFYFDGGPGIAATNSAAFFAMKNNPYRKHHDIVLVDARGTGGSHPLNCYNLQYQKGIAQKFDKDDPEKELYPANEVKACYDSLSKIADLTQYTTTNIANDIEEVRQGLGYKKIHVYGLSYGTRLAQEYLRRFPSSVETVVLWSPTSTGSRMPLYHAKFAQASLEKLFRDCANDSLCRTNYRYLQKEFDGLMEKGKQQNFKTVYTFFDNTTKELSISWNIFQSKLRSLMYMPAGLRQIPFIIHEAYSGNWKPFLSLYKEKGEYDNFLAEGLYLCITCAEDVPFINQTEVQPLTRNTFMGNYRIAQQQSACSVWARGNIPKDFLEFVHSNIPVLILSGEYDPVTPVSMAKKISQHLSKSQLVIIPEMSHMFDGLSHEECFDNMVIEFINSNGKAKVKSDCIVTMKPSAYK